MFGRGQTQGNGETRTVEIPPARALMVTELVKGRPTDASNDQKWDVVTYYGHNIQTTESGGLNILRIVEIPGRGIVQQMVVGLPNGYWRRLYEDIDLRQSSPLAIN